MTAPKEEGTPETSEAKAPDSSKEEEKKEDAQATPGVMYWRWTTADRELFSRVKAMLRIASNTDVLRFALGAAERELTRAGGS